MPREGEFQLETVISRELKAGILKHPINLSLNWSALFRNRNPESIIPSNKVDPQRSLSRLVDKEHSFCCGGGGVFQKLKGQPKTKPPTTRDNVK